MGRSEPRSARAVATARLFIGTLLTTQKEGLCHMEASSVLQQWKKLRGRKQRGVAWVADNAFMKALNRFGAVRQRVQTNGRRSYECVMMFSKPACPS